MYGPQDLILKIILTVTPPAKVTLSLESPRRQEVVAGDVAAYCLKVERSFYTGPITVGVPDLDQRVPGALVDVNPAFTIGASDTPDAVHTVDVLIGTTEPVPGDKGTPPSEGRLYTIAITASLPQAVEVNTVEVKLDVTLRLRVAITVEPDLLKVTAGETARYTVRQFRYNFTGEIQRSVAGLPPNALFKFVLKDTDNIAPQIRREIYGLEIDLPPRTTPQKYPLIIETQYTSNGKLHAASAKTALRVRPVEDEMGLEISVPPGISTRQEVFAGEPVRFPIKAQRTNYSGPFTLDITMSVPVTLTGDAPGFRASNDPDRLEEQELVLQTDRPRGLVVTEPTGNILFDSTGATSAGRYTITLEAVGIPDTVSRNKLPLEVQVKIRPDVQVAITPPDLAQGRGATARFKIGPFSFNVTEALSPIVTVVQDGDPPVGLPCGLVADPKNLVAVSNGDVLVYLLDVTIPADVKTGTYQVTASAPFPNTEPRAATLRVPDPTFGLRIDPEEEILDGGDRFDCRIIVERRNFFNEAIDLEIIDNGGVSIVFLDGEPIPDHKDAVRIPSGKDAVRMQVSVPINTVERVVSVRVRGAAQGGSLTAEAMLTLNLRPAMRVVRLRAALMSKEAGLDETVEFTFEVQRTNFPKALTFEAKRVNGRDLPFDDIEFDPPNPIGPGATTVKVRVTTRRGLTPGDTYRIRVNTKVPDDVRLSTIGLNPFELTVIDKPLVRLEPDGRSQDALPGDKVRYRIKLFRFNYTPDVVLQILDCSKVPIASGGDFGPEQDRDERHSYQELEFSTSRFELPDMYQFEVGSRDAVVVPPPVRLELNLRPRPSPQPPPGPGPTITAFSPTNGAVLTPVNIAEDHFTGATAVGFNGVQAAFSVVSPTYITATVPAGAATGPISVTSPAGTATTAGSFTVMPPVSRVDLSASPNTASIRAGQSASYTVTLNRGPFTGAVALAVSGLLAGVTDAFHPNPATGPSAALTINTAADAALGTYPVTISGTAPGATIAPISVSLTVQSLVISLPMISGFTPTSGPVGMPVTISGVNFTGATAVTFNGVAAAYTVTSPASIRAIVLAGATMGVLGVTTPDATGTSTEVFTATPAKDKEIKDKDKEREKESDVGKPQKALKDSREGKGLLTEGAFQTSRGIAPRALDAAAMRAGGWRHFIGQGLRPDLEDSALAAEPDLTSPAAFGGWA